MDQRGSNAAVQPRQILGFWLIGCLLLMVFHGLVPNHWRAATVMDYELQTKGLLEGRGFLGEDGTVSDRYPPLFPLLLAAQFATADRLGIERVTVTSLVSITTASLAGVLMLQCALLVVPLPMAAFAGFAVLLMPHLAYATLKPLSVVPYVTLLMAVVTVVLRQVAMNRIDLSRWAFIGFLVAVMMLLRPIAILFPLVVVVVVLGAYRQHARRQKVQVMLAFALTLFLTLLPWEAWVLAKKGELIPLSSGGASSLRDGISFNTKSFREPLAFGPRLEEFQSRIGEQYTTLNERGAFRRFLVAEFARDPLAVVQLYALKVRRAWYGTDSQNKTIEMAGGVLAILLVLPSLLSLYYIARQQLRAAGAGTGLKFWGPALCILIVLYHWLFASLFNSLVRYMVPAMTVLPLLWCFALQARLERNGVST